MLAPVMSSLTLDPGEIPLDDAQRLALQRAEEAAFAQRAQAAVELLEAVRERRGLLAALDNELRERLLRAAGEVARPDPWAKRELSRAAYRRRRDELRARDEQALAQTGIRKKRQEEVFVTPLLGEPPVPAGSDIDRTLAALDGTSRELPEATGVSVVGERSCYVCKRRFRSLHFFYDSMCASCGDLNYQKRQQTADLTGKVALITGSRVKIGYQAAIMLLRAGARVIVTTRFPRDAAARYARESDFEVWGARLQIHGLDLRHTPSVEAFAKHLDGTLERLDYIINNACQTVRRPPGFYEHMLEREHAALEHISERERGLLSDYESLRGGPSGARALGSDAAPAGELQPGLARALAEAGQPVGLSNPAGLSQLSLLEEDLLRGPQLFPRGMLDADLQQIDLRERNSWRLSLSEVSAVELLEVQLVNAVAPFMLNARLKSLMQRVPTRDKHIVNVSAMEGQFYRSFKTDKHPHTNMAKAALNMMTRTSAADYVKDGIHMNSVDTGWVTDEDVATIAARKTKEQGFHPPLDIVDGAARIVDPIFAGVNSGSHVWGMFLKDYAPTDW
ncbi:MAG: L-fuco-beta-pyranose dehydrogenase [Myxococcaceae bacterium]|nr:L-fuco-beta-pyranose dehydrogenase [Myxococcaceae bacterium]